MPPPPFEIYKWRGHIFSAAPGSPISYNLTYFLLDTRTGNRTDFTEYQSLQKTALRLKIQPALIPIGDIYFRYRWTWFDGLAGVLMVGPPLACVLLYVRWLWWVRRKGKLVARSAPIRLMTPPGG